MKFPSTTSGFLDWEFGKCTRYPQGIWLYRPAIFDYRTSTGLGETDSTLGGDKQNLACTRTQGKGVVTHRRLNKTYLRHTVIKLKKKIKDKDKILKATRAKWQITGNSHKVISWFLNRNSTNQKGNSTIYLKWWTGRTYNQENFTQQDFYSDLKEKSSALQTSKT